MFASWLVLVGGWMPISVLVVAHRKGLPGASLLLWLAGISLPLSSLAATVAFGFVLGRWVPMISSRVKIGCAAPAGCLSWVLWFAIAYAIPIAGVSASDDVSTDDSGAFGVIVLGPPVLLLIIVLLRLGVERGAARRAHATDHAE
ncbi:hypothetical protein [Actinoallomurus sp. CA-142502]|uniref:hypothetical protein n=1 Tax=Actinoallomurus sp. CA-142502 TaxID=3239885 RepID=UPI003D941749